MLLPVFDVLATFIIKKIETHSLPHHENERQQSINDVWCCILANLSGDWLQTFINELLPTFIGKGDSDMLPAPF